jgi:putative transposase
LQEAETGTKAMDVCRKYGISDATYYNWKAKYRGMTISDARKLRVLEEENRRLKHMVADPYDNRTFIYYKLGNKVSCCNSAKRLANWENVITGKLL